MPWAQIATTVLASFLACLVECVEALTVVLAVGAVRGWRPALIGAGSALALLLLAVAAFGTSMDQLPLAFMQMIIGALLLLLGLSWLRKAIMRSAGVRAMRDEGSVYAAQLARLQALERPSPGGWDRVAAATAFKIVMLEGFKVVFPVLAIGADSRLLRPAAAGALGALSLVSVLGFWLHRPLQRIPENTLKFAVGIMLAAFGTFWLVEGVGFAWPGGDVAVLGLLAGYFLAARLCVLLWRGRTARPT
jgi:Ca2+/H+ antiporter, TMEM165/GDT1 family